MAETETGQKRQVRLLLVDDEVDYLRVLSNRMRKRGFHVVTANTGAKGIQALRKEDFDVAVLDLKMEDIDGIEMLKIFKKMVPELAVIMLTGHGSEKAAREGFAAGAFEYLSKPCDFQELLGKIQEAYQAKQEGN